MDQLKLCPPLDCPHCPRMGPSSEIGGYTGTHWRDSQCGPEVVQASLEAGVPPSNAPAHHPVALVQSAGGRRGRGVFLCHHISSNSILSDSSQVPEKLQRLTPGAGVLSPFFLFSTLIHPGMFVVGLSLGGDIEDAAAVSELTSRERCVPLVSGHTRVLEQPGLRGCGERSDSGLGFPSLLYTQPPSPHFPSLSHVTAGPVFILG